MLSLFVQFQANKKRITLTRNFSSILLLFGNDRRYLKKKEKKKKGKKKRKREKTKAGRNQINRHNASVFLSQRNQGTLARYTGVPS